MKTRKTVAALIGLLSLVVAGCNTMKGVGKDIEKGGEAIQKAAS